MTIAPKDLMLVICFTFIWGFNFVVVRLGLDSFPPLFFLALRFLLAALPAIFFIGRSGISTRMIICIGLVLGTLHYGALYLGIAFGVPRAIFAEAGLSFIGLGIRPPTASWGNMIQDGFASIYSNSVLIAAPAICVALILLAFTFLGDGLRDALDPRMKQ